MMKENAAGRLIRRTLHALRGNWGAFFRFGIAWKLGSYFLLIPLLGRMANLVTRINLIQYLNDANYRRVLRNPLSWLLLLAMWAVYTLYSLVELLGTCAALVRSDAGERLTARDIFQEGVNRVLRLRPKGNLLLTVFAVLMTPVTSIHIAVSVTELVAVAARLLGTLIGMKAVNALFALFAFLGCCLLFRWIWAIPIMILENTDFARARAKSMRLTRRGVFRSMLSAAGYAILSALAAAFIVGLILLGVRYGFLWLEPRADTARLITGQMITITATCVSYVLSWCVSTVLYARIYAGYLDTCARRGDAVPACPPVRISRRRRKITGCAAFALALAVAFFCVPGRYQQIKGALVGTGRPIMVMAHRGGAADAPENTLPAFEAAIENGADSAELDVQMTRDGVIVLLHDPTLTRTAGVKANIWDLDYADIRELDFGSFFSPRFAGTRIPTLDEVMKLTKDKLYLNIEIKRTGHDEGIVEKVLEIIAANEYQDMCDITSMDYQTLIRVRELNPDIYTVYTTTVGRGALAEMECASAFSIERTFVSAGLVQYLHGAGKGIYVWTVNSRDDISSMIDLNVDALITDRPALARRCLDGNSFASRLRRVMF